MKKSVVSFFIALIVGVSYLPTASGQSISLATAPEADAFQTSVLIQDGTKVKVYVNKAAASKLKIRILDAKNTALATKQVDKNEATSRTLFDLTSLADGTYFVEITDGTRKQVKQIELKTTPPATASRSILLS